VPQVALDTFMQDQDIKRCRDLCDKGKHVTLTKREGPVAQVRTSGGALGLDGLGLAPLGCPTVTWLLQFGDESVELLPLAERVLGKWKGFFQANGL
jgi:hypothetical protein